MVEIDVNAMMFLKAYRPRLTHQQYSDLREKLLAGDSISAMKDLKQILAKRSPAS